MERPRTDETGTPDDAPSYFSLTRGGPFYRLLRKTRIVRLTRGDALRLSLLVLTFTWLPLAAIAGVEWWRDDRISAVFSDLGMHARFLVSVPAFFVAESLLEQRTDRALHRFWEDRVSPDANAQTYAHVTRVAATLRDSWRLDVFLVAAAVLSGGGSLEQRNNPTGVFQILANMTDYSPAQVWYGAVGLTTFRFLLYRTLAHWVAWCSILFGLSRLDIRPVATHPDHAGGLDFLSEPVIGAAFLAFGTSAAAAGGWGTNVFLHGADLKPLAVPVATLAVTSVAVALGPLLLFTPHLYRARLDAFRTYGTLAFAYTRMFHRRWIDGKVDESLLGSSDIQSLADLGNSYESLRRMQLVPINKRIVIGMLAAVMLPMLPLLARDLSFAEILGKLGGGLLGAVAPY